MYWHYAAEYVRETDTYTKRCSCGHVVEMDGDYVREFPTVSTEEAMRRMVAGCTCPPGEVYKNLTDNCRISIVWSEDDKNLMKQVKMARYWKSPRTRAELRPTALNYGDGWVFFNRRVGTPPVGNPTIWIEF